MSKEIVKITTGVFRVSYPNLATPRAFGDAEENKKYSVQMLIPKNVGVAMYLEAMKKAAKLKWGSDAKNRFEKIKRTNKWPLHDGDKDKPEDENYEGHYFIKAQRSEEKGPPPLLDRKSPGSPEDFYPGCYARAILICNAYENKFGQGFGFSLQGIQKVKEGERIGGNSDVAAEFEDGFNDFEEAALDDFESSDDF